MSSTREPMGRKWWRCLERRDWRGLGQISIWEMPGPQSRWRAEQRQNQHSGSLFKVLSGKVIDKVVIINYNYILAGGGYDIRSRINQAEIHIKILNIESILGTNDRHWTPVYLQCNLCHTTFQFILTLETLHEDETALFSDLNISNKLHHGTSNRWNEKGEIFQNKIFSGTRLRSLRLCGKIMNMKLKSLLLFRIWYELITELSV